MISETNEFKAFFKANGQIKAVIEVRVEALEAQLKAANELIAAWQADIERRLAAVEAWQAAQDGGK